MTNPYGGPPSGPQPQQPYGQPGYGPPSGPQPQQPYAAPGYGGYPGYPGVPTHPAGPLAEWGTRVLGYLIDGGIPAGVFMILYLITMFIGVGAASGGSSSAATTALVVVVVIIGVAALALTAFNIWNLAYKRGTTGQTIGQRVVKIKTVSEETGQPIGFGNAFLRQLAHVLDGLPCNVGFLAPLWDDKNQTWADKIMHTVVVRADPNPPGMPPAAGPGQPGGYPPPQAGIPPQQPGTPGGGFPGPQPGYGPPPQS